MPDTISEGTTQGSFQQSLVEIGSVVSEEKIFFLISSPFFLFLAWVRRFGPLTKMAARLNLV
jgi:hypothetical protein